MLQGSGDCGVIPSNGQSSHLKGTDVNTSSSPSFAWVAGSWGALSLGILAFLIGLNNATMQLNEKGYYFTVLMYGLFAAVSLQKSVRDREEGIPVTSVYYGLCWFSLITALSLLTIGLYNAQQLLRSEKGFYGMAFALALFAAAAVQKNTRDS
ncbi:MAG: inner membrane protein YiaA [Longimicrobiales bacterium]